MLSFKDAQVVVNAVNYSLEVNCSKHGQLVEEIELFLSGSEPRVSNM